MSMKNMVNPQVGQRLKMQEYEKSKWVRGVTENNS
jgi:hypothetical protein